MKPLFLIFLTFLLVFPNVKQKSNSSHKNHQPVWAQLIYYQLKDKYHHRALSTFHTAAVTGHKFKTPPRLKKILRSLHIEHLLTPSGLHLSILTSWLFPFLGRMRKLLCLCPVFFLQQFYSLKRIALLKTLNILFPKFNRLHLFMWVTVIDFIFGSFKFSPFSFIYGFLFLGSLIATTYKKELTSHHIPFRLLGAQCMVAYSMDTNLYIVGFFICLVATSLFSLIFPQLILDILFLKLQLFEHFLFSKWLLLKWWNLLLFGQKLSYFFGAIEINILIILAIFLILVRFYKIAGLFILLSSASLWNAPKNSKEIMNITLPKDFIRVEQTKWGYKTWHKQKGRCHHRHRPVGIEITCNF